MQLRRVRNINRRHGCEAAHCPDCLISANVCRITAPVGAAATLGRSGERGVPDLADPFAMLEAETLGYILTATYAVPAGVILTLFLCCSGFAQRDRSLGRP